MTHPRTLISGGRRLCVAMALAMSAYAANVTAETVRNQPQFSLAEFASVDHALSGGYAQQAVNELEHIATVHPLSMSALDPVGAESSRAFASAWHVRHAAALIGLRKAKPALDELNAALQVDPNNADLHRTLGEAQGLAAELAGPLGGFSRARQALHEFQLAAELGPQNPDNHYDLALFYAMAPGIVGGSTEGAHQEIDLLRQLNPILADRAQAILAQQQSKFSEASAALSQAVVIDSSGESALQLAVLELQLNQAASAWNLLQSLHAQHADDAKCWFWLGETAVQLQAHTAEGIDALERYVTASARPDDGPALAWAYLRLAQLKARQQDYAGAQTALHTALQHQPTSDLNLRVGMGESEFHTTLNTLQSTLSAAATTSAGATTSGAAAARPLPPTH